MKRVLPIILAIGSVLSSSACRDDTSAKGAGKLRIMLEADSTVSGGLDRGDADEGTQDYSVSFSKYVATVGNIKMKKNSTGDTASLPSVFIADLKQVGEQGIELGVLDDLEAGQWDKFGYETPAATDKAQAVGDVDPAEVDLMIENGWTYWIEGRVLRADAEGGPVTFVIQTEAATLFSDCGNDGELGVTVVEDRTGTARITLHGDHLFFNSFPNGSEGSIKRLAGWVIAADKDDDGKVSTEDLKSLDATEVFSSTAGYSLDGKPAELDIENALDFVRAQLATQGHLNGEGGCAWRFKGATGR